MTLNINRKLVNPNWIKIIQNITKINLRKNNSYKNKRNCNKNMIQINYL
jgi:hypothetical protein